VVGLDLAWVFAEQVRRDPSVDPLRRWVLPVPVLAQADQTLVSVDLYPEAVAVALRDDRLDASDLRALSSFSQ